MENGNGYVKSPAFQIYPADFLADKNTLVMSAAEVGAYWLLICVCWRENGLPDDVEELADLARTPAKIFQVSWDKRLKRCFIQREDGKWTHNRLQKERDKQIANREKRQDAGAKGADQRWQKNSNAKPRPLPKSNSEIAKPKSDDSKRIASDSLSSSSSISSSTSISTSEEKTDRPAKKQRDERITHPAIIAVLEVKGKYPNKDVWDLVIKTLGGHPDVPKLRECWVAWRTKDYSPGALGWLVDWYVNGIPGGLNGTNKDYQRPTAADKNANQLSRNLAVVEELRRQSR